MNMLGFRRLTASQMVDSKHLLLHLRDVDTSKKNELLEQIGALLVEL